MMVLTDRQAVIVEFVRTYRAGHRRPPTAQEIADTLGISSRQLVAYHLSEIERKGYATFDRVPPATVLDDDLDAGQGPDRSLYFEVLAERFGARPPWREMWARPSPPRYNDDALTLALRRLELNEAMEEPVGPGGFGRRAAA